MRVEFAAPDDEQKSTVATAEWDGHEVTVASEDGARRESLAHAFRRIPLVTDDASYRRLGTSGVVVIQPGTLEWFRAVAQARVPAEIGLVARFVPGAPVGGFDPAAGYRTFEEQIKQLDERSRGG